MAALSVSDRTKIYRGVMRYWSAKREACAFTKPDLYSPSGNTGIIADLDNWIDTHSGTTSADTVGANGALTVPMRAALTTEQKGFLVAVIALLRTGNVELLKAVVGGSVD